MQIPVYVKHAPFSQFNTALSWIIVGGFFVIIELAGFTGSFHSLVTWVFRPALEVNRTIVQTIEWPVATAFEARKLARRVQQLEIQYAQAIADLSKLEGVEEENRELKRLLENTDRSFRETRVAGSLVSLARPAVSVGKDEGIEVGNEVIVNGILIGSVSEVTPTLSFISLLTQPDHPAVLAQTSQDTKGVVVGTGRALMLTEVPLDAPLEIGDRVITLGQPGISSDLVIGQVVRIEKDPAAPIKEAQLEQVVDFYQTRIVEIIL